MVNPIRTKADVEFHSEGWAHDPRPAVNVKVRGFWENEIRLPIVLSRVKEKGETKFKDVWTDPGFTVEWIRENLSDDDFNSFFWQTCGDGWEYLNIAAREIWGNHVKVYSEGKHDGWAVVEGINQDVDSWDAAYLSKWRAFAKIARATADDIHRSTVESIYFNCYQTREVANVS